jgi:hypothetical protein
MGHTVIGNIRPRYGAVVVTLEQLEAALYTLAAYLEEPDWDRVDEVVEAAKRSLIEGSDQLPPLLTTLAGSQFGRTTIEGRDILNAEFRAGGHVRRAWEHNVFGMRMSPVFGKVRIHAYILSDTGVSPELYGLDVGWSNFHVDLNRMLAEACGVSRVLESVSVSFPMTVVDKTQFIFDLAPYIRGLYRLGIDPMSCLNLMDGRKQLAAFTHEAISESQRADQAVKDAIDWFDYRTGNGLRGHSFVTSAEWYFEQLAAYPGMAVNLATYGTQFGARQNPWDSWTPAYRRVGSVITGPINSYDGILDEPIALVTIKRPHKTDRGPVWQSLHTVELREPFFDLAAAVANMLAH